MTKIPAHKNFKNTKIFKTSQKSFGPREELLGRAGFYIEIFSWGLKAVLSATFRGLKKLAIFPAAITRQKRRKL
jgi:hypothetical protein